MPNLTLKDFSSEVVEWGKKDFNTWWNNLRTNSSNPSTFWAKSIKNNLILPNNSIRFSWIFLISSALKLRKRLSKLVDLGIFA